MFLRFPQLLFDEQYRFFRLIKITFKKRLKSKNNEQVLIKKNGDYEQVLRSAFTERSHSSTLPDLATRSLVNVVKPYKVEIN